MTTVTIPAGVQIAQAIYEALRSKGRMVSYSETDWASATFHGARHNYTIRFDGPMATENADSLVARIDDADIKIRGHLVADITLNARRDFVDNGAVVELDISALTLAE